MHFLSIALVAFAMLYGTSTSASPSITGTRLDPKTNYLYWFHCVLENRQLSSDALAKAEISKAQGALEQLMEDSTQACHGIPMAIPPAFHNRTSRASSRLGIANGARLELHFPRETLTKTKPPENMKEMNFFRVALRPLHQWEPFFISDPKVKSAQPPSRTETFLVGLRGFDKVQPTNMEENGFQIYETPTNLREATHGGKRVFAPTADNPNIFMACALETRDSTGVKRNFPACTVRTTLDGLFEIEYGILGQDAESIRALDKRLKEMIRDFFVPPSQRPQRATPVQ
jgi:hypothetical protein